MRRTQYAGLKHQLARYRAMPSSPEVDERIERIVLNLERWRWLPDNLGPRYVMVNIPAFRLDVIERPVDVARYVLGDQPAWTTEKIDEAMHAGVERSVTLKQPLPVYLVYFTAWEENGDVQMGDDVYQYEKKQRMAAGV